MFIVDFANFIHIFIETKKNHGNNETSESLNTADYSISIRKKMMA